MVAGVLLGFVIQYFPSADQVGINVTLGSFLTMGILTLYYMGIFCMLSCLILLETLGHEAFLLGSWSVCIYRLRQWCGWLSWLWRSLHPGVGIPGWSWMGDRKGDSIYKYRVFVNKNSFL